MSLRKAINEKCKEIWSDIDGAEERYYVSNYGRVKSNRQILKQQVSREGYYVISIRKKPNGKISTHLVHRLMAIAFIPNTYKKPEINHKNGIKKDNKLDNFEWVTKSEQAKHAWKNKLNTSKNHCYGEGHYKSILKENDVINILSSDIPTRKLASMYGVSLSAIQHIKRGRSWKHLQEQV